jgi:hypothetical protein
MCSSPHPPVATPPRFVTPTLSLQQGETLYETNSDPTTEDSTAARCYPLPNPQQTHTSNALPRSVASPKLNISMPTRRLLKRPYADKPTPSLTASMQSYPSFTFLPPSLDRHILTPPPPSPSSERKQYPRQTVQLCIASIFRLTLLCYIIVQTRGGTC